MEALRAAAAFAERFPVVDKGLFFLGPPGVGKTHLAVAALREVIGSRGARGYFYKTAELLQKIRNTYNNSVEETEMGILTPIFDADVLVLDDVGLERPTEWVQETLGVLIDKRYSNQKPTILTGNLNDDSSGKDFVDSVQFRLGPRTRSRLLEMCRWSSSRATIRASWGFTPPTRKSGSGTSARNSSTDKCPTSRKGWPKRDFAQAATRSSNGPEGRAAREHAGSLPAHPVLRRDLQLLQLQPGPARRGTQDAYVDALTAKSKRPPSPKPWSTRSISAVARRRC